jgi:hypothetical protein
VSTLYGREGGETSRPRSHFRAARSIGGPCRPPRVARERVGAARAGAARAGEACAPRVFLTFDASLLFFCSLAARRASSAWREMRRVWLVRVGERGVSDWYGMGDTACPLSRWGGRGVSLRARRSDQPLRERSRDQATSDPWKSWIYRSESAWRGGGADRGAAAEVVPQLGQVLAQGLDVGAVGFSGQGGGAARM